MYSVDQQEEDKIYYMKTTYTNTSWNNASLYYIHRMPLVDKEIENFLLPRVIKNIQPSNISLAELASGLGGITQSMVSKLQEHGYTIERLVVIDVLQKNLDIAAEFVNSKFPDLKIEKFLCNGNNFSNFNLDPVDVLYCWDAMVHFDIHDVAGYLQTLNKVSRGLSIFHHSNYQRVIRRIEENLHWRNFMTKDVFHQLSISVGHTVLEQTVIDWYSYDSLDCITTLKVNQR